MGELEKRLAAVELLLIEVAPWLAVEALDDAAAAIRAGLHGGPISADEREIRMYALQLLTDDRNRFAPGAAGRWVRGEED